MILLIQTQNNYNTSSDIAEPTSSHTYYNSHTALPSNLFRWDQPPSGLLNPYRSNLSFSKLLNSFRLDLTLDHEKTDEEPMGKFYSGVFVVI